MNGYWHHLSTCHTTISIINPGMIYVLVTSFDFVNDFIINKINRFRNPSFTCLTGFCIVIGISHSYSSNLDCWMYFRIFGIL